MSNSGALEQLEHQVAQLPPQEQLELVARISERLSTMPTSTLTVVSEESLRRQREREADELLALCNAAAEMWRGEFALTGFTDGLRICQSHVTPLFRNPAHLRSSCAVETLNGS